MTKNHREAEFRDANKSIVIIGDNNTVKKGSTIITPTKVLVSVVVLLTVAGAGWFTYSLTASHGSGPPGVANTNRPSQPPDETSHAEVTSRLSTDIKLRAGDRAVISAEGQIRLGILAGVGDPDGVPGFTEYNILSDSRHGALFARIKSEDDEDKWKRIGKQGTLLAKQDGVLELLVNDNDPKNNDGSFKVTVQIYRRP